MKLQASGVVLILIGALSLAGSFAWNRVVPASAYWTDAQGEEYVESAARYHNLASPRNQADTEYLEARGAYETRRAELDQAVTGRRRTPRVLRIVGLTLSVAGVALILIHRGRTA